MFDTLGDRLAGILKRLRNKGRLTPDDVNEMLGEIRTALLEADVNVISSFPEVLGLTSSVKHRGFGNQ